jgi:hypothetical protein
MANTIKHKRGSGSDPSANDLVAGEIAIRTDTGVLFIKKDDNSIASISGGTTNLGVSTTSSAVTVTSSTGNNATISEASSNAAGVMSTAHHDKLDGIEANATADQTAAEILTALKTVDGAGSGLDADTLDGISSASFLRSDAADTKTSGHLTFNDNVKAQFGGSGDLQISHDGSASYIADIGPGNLNIQTNGGGVVLTKGSSENLAKFITDGAVELYYDNAKKLETSSSGISVTGNVVVSGTVDGRDVASDGSKLDGIEANATADQSASEILTAVKTVDGSGSGLDADLLDGVQGSSFLRSDAADTKTSGHLTFNDNVKAQFGGSGDLQLVHDATDSFITNSTGDLHVRSEGDDLYLRAADDIFIRPQGGENGIIVYGGAEVELFYANSKKFDTKADGCEVIGELECDSLDVDGAGDFTGDVTFRGGAAAVNVAADSDIRLANGTWTGDFAAKLQHHGNYLYIQGGSNGIVFRAAGGSDRAIIDSSGHFRPTADDTYDLGTSSVQWRNAYFDGTVNADALDVDGAADISGNLTLHANLDLQDNDKILVGSGDDLEIYHDGSNSYIADTGTGNLFIRANSQLVLESNNGENYLAANENGDVHLYYDGGVRISTKSDGANVVGELECDSLDVDGGIDIDGGQIYYDADNNNLHFIDNVKARFGTSSDLRIYHDGSNSFIDDSGTGNLYIRSNLTQISKYTGETCAKFTADGSVELFYDNTVKVNTTSSGIDVSGIVDIDSHIRHNGDGNTYFGFNGNDQINFYTNGGHRFQIDSSGHLYFGQFSTSIPGLGNTTVGASYEKLSSGGAFFTSRSDGPGLFVNRNNDGDVIQFYRSGNGKGSISVNNSGSNFNNGSDYRLKENIVDLTGAITRLKQLQPKRFNFIADSEVTQDGFIAHEAATVLPWAVTGTHNQIELWGDYETDELPEGVSVGDPKLDDDGNTIPVMQGMDYGKVTPLLTAALQEAIAKIETLEAQNADLLARVTALEGS